MRHPATRRVIAQRREQGWSRAAVAAAFDVSERTVSKWHRRYRDESEAGL